jgi:hypothetical protein
MLLRNPSHRVESKLKTYPIDSLVISSLLVDTEARVAAFDAPKSLSALLNLLDLFIFNLYHLSV